MFSYRICGYTFHSNTPIVELTPSDDQQSEFIFQLRSDTRPLSGVCNWLNHWYAQDGSIWLSFARFEEGYLLRFPAYADFIVSTDARSVSCHLRQNCPPQTMRHLLLNQVIPIVLSRLGKLVIHASACATPKGVMAFMGVTGAGKSTLAATFGLRGFSVLTDDCLLVEKQMEGIIAIPSYPGLRLWPETIMALFDREPELQPLAHYTDKKRLLLDQDQSADPLLLRVIYVLSEPEKARRAGGVEITPLGAGQALLETVKHTFQLDVTDRKGLEQAFRQYEWLAKAVPFFRLNYPHEHGLLSSVHTAILKHFDHLRNRRHTYKDLSDTKYELYS
jgi:hypothetical protein